MSHKRQDERGLLMFKDLDQRIKIRYIPEILEGRFDYLLQYSQWDKDNVPFETNGIAEGVSVRKFVTSDEDLETAINDMDEILKHIIAEYAHICVRQMPSVDIINDNYVITVRLAYCNDSEVT